MKTQKIYLSVLMLVIIVPLSIKGVNAFSKDQTSADKMINDNKEYALKIEEMKIKIERLRKEIDTRQTISKSTSHNSDKPQAIYTIQLGSYLTFSRAQGEFNYLMEVFAKKYRSFLRVEKVGTFYTVRLGKFESYSSSEKYLKSLIPKKSKARILKAFLKFDRVRSCICY